MSCTLKFLVSRLDGVSCFLQLTIVHSTYTSICVCCLCANCTHTRKMSAACMLSVQKNI